ncbi:hypothetical protein PINS_up006250 [Pythium insidiosum]|nr:hypothetical protein PINS_up006250 [Pythium insidiosum]
MPGPHEKTPLVVGSRVQATARDLTRAQANELGTPRFPLHPYSSSTPWWRKLCFQFFDNTADHDSSSLQPSDLWELPRDLQSSVIAEELQRCLAACDRQLFRAVWRLDGPRLSKGFALALGATVLRMLYPLLLYRLLSLVVAEERAVLSSLVSHVALVFGVSMGHRILHCHSQAQTKAVAAHVGSGLRVLLLRELLQHSAQRSTMASNQSGRDKQRLGELAMLYEDDYLSVCVMISNMNLVWTDVIEVMGDVAIVLLVLSVPWRVLLVDALVFGVVWAFEHWERSRLTASWRVKLATRVNVIHECFRGIQNVKLNAWEHKMQQKIEHARLEEVQELRRMSYLRAVCSTLGAEVSNVAAALTFAWLVFLDRSLTPASAFTTLIIFERLRDKMKSLRRMWDTLARGALARTRIQDQLSRNAGVIHTQPSTPARSELQAAIALHNVWLSCSGLPHATDVLVANANLTVRRGELVVIHGLAGVGKSLLLSAIRGDIDVLQGHVHVDASLRVAYCSQEPWLQTMSIRDNVLFGSAFDERKYWCVMDACGLLEDLEQLPMGDATQVGPKGINLSGGQKARIALARACYADADLYLLDCPLASVDAVVQSDVFRKCVVELLVHKTIVMVTHNPEIMGSSFVDQVVELHGTQLRSSSTVIGGSSRASSKEWQSRRRAGLGGMPPWRRSSSHRVADLTASLNFPMLAVSTCDRMRNVQKASEKADQPRCPVLSVSKDTLRTIYSAPDSQAWFLVSLVALFVWVLLKIGKDVWIVWWVAGDLDGRGLTRPAIIFAALVAGSSIASLLASISHQLLYFRATDRLFCKMTKSLLHATMSFFYVTPIGDIVNAFFGDIGGMDTTIGPYSMLLCSSLLSHAASLIVLWILVGWGGIYMAVLSLATWQFVMGVRLFGRLFQIEGSLGDENIAFMSEVLDGESIVRAFGDDHIRRVDEAHCRLIDFGERQRMLSFYYNCQLLVRSTTTSGASLLLLVAVVTLQSISSAELGLLVYYIVNFQSTIINIGTGALNAWSCIYGAQHIQALAETETETEQHAVAPITDIDNWPATGIVVFEHVTFSYETSEVQAGTAQYDLPYMHTPGLALRDVSFSVRSGERVGVVGRTGSGKSSLAMALFRMHPLVSGRILVDGVDISRLSLKTVRSSITIIPQTPLFYRCSVRDYLDPFGEYDDGRLWREVKRVGLGGHVRSLSDELWDNGENWSLGERQMLCFARALLRPSRVLVLDEAFSSVDQGREESLLGLLEDSVQPQQQQQQQSPYSNRDDGGGRCERGVASSTVFLITHRVDQILGFDRILVMANGSVVEQGSATSLASDPSSLFYDFLETSLLTM